MFFQRKRESGPECRAWLIVFIASSMASVMLDPFSDPEPFRGYEPRSNLQSIYRGKRGHYVQQFARSSLLNETFETCPQG
ncbi:hypothetical protein JB92DRAFT_2863566 [Gautieria morchelliformis]|nr:hypothetical protein JB92DRAFT_3068882 [Gautieria morchelliformis]KAF8528624.1 hypothetical protein JB92DRAFT_2863566 [Gautieria morchelliformis]